MWSPMESRWLHNVDWQGIEAPTRDPYLIWADATNGVGLGAAGGKTIPVAFEVRTAADYKKLRSRLVKDKQPVPVQVAERFGTMRVDLSHLPALLAKPYTNWLHRIELGLPVQTPENYAVLLSASAAEPSDASQPSKTYAVLIDDGCAFAHPQFSARGASRLHRLWVQEDVSDHHGHLGYQGSELDQFATHGSARAIYDAFSQDLAARAADAAGADFKRQMLSPATHGTHLLDVMAGTRNPLARKPYRYGAPNDAASAAPIIFVQLPRAAVRDTSGASMACQVLEALVYIRASVPASDRAVINLSYGALAGPHDGSSLLEAAIDAFLQESANMELCLPAGNGYDSRTHAQRRIPGSGHHGIFELDLLPADPTDTFVELWYPKTAGAAVAKLELRLTGPGVPASDWVPLNGLVEFARPNAPLPIAAVLHLGNPNAGRDKNLALIALAPTSPSVSRPHAPHGRWTIELRNAAPADVAVDAWIERDDSAFGSGRSRSQARFVSGALGWPPGAAHSAGAPIVRNRCLNSFAHGSAPTVVGGYTLNVGDRGAAREVLATYSASGPGRTKLGFAGPDAVCPCERWRGVGVLAAGTRALQPIYLDGTSVASAAMARILINRTTMRTPPPAYAPIPTNPHPPSITPPPVEWRQGAGRQPP